MIKEKELREMRERVRFQDGKGITLHAIRDALAEYFNEAEIPVKFYFDQIKFGGLISNSTGDCLVLCHPDHMTDYYKIAVQVKHQGKFAYVSVNDFGTSKLLGNQGSADYLKQVLSFNSGAAVSEKIGALIGAGARALVKGGVNKQKLEEEQDWYAFVSEAFDDIIS